jgi:hypothetical protein
MKLWEHDTRDIKLIDEIRALGPANIVSIGTDQTPEKVGLELERIGHCLHPVG